MKNVRIISLVSIALFALTGCKKQCSKQEFMDLANKTETHQYAKATATCKGNISSKAASIEESYVANDTFNFVYRNRQWQYDGDLNSLKAFRQSLVYGCLSYISMNVKDFLKEDPFLTEGDRKGLTCYSSPLGFNYKVDYKDSKQEAAGYSGIVNGTADSTFTFDNTGAVIEYIEKSDISMDMDISGTTITSTSKTDLTVNISYQD